ncbi:MAG: ribonucleotide-diphosphate reductase subunit beta [Ureaplasma sp.]|nr:ribonucleotide-diphosphate reductase subunit beta [Ureaplasma sp.]MDE7221744.1 ribonucleotide-diphosphate reductase subunit beta [Ureaplasma sp.]
MEKLVELNWNVKPKDIKIFLGKYNGFQRYDLVKYPFAKQIEANMRQAFWTPEEISLISDRENFKDLSESAQNVVIKNLLFQTLMDSAQNRGLDAIMSELVTSSEWEAVFKTQAFFELIHSLSYSHIIREMFSSNASEIFDQIYMIDEIKHRTDKEIDAYTKMKEYLQGQHKEWTEEETKKNILELLLRIYFLEGLKFYVSFLVTYTINYNYNDAIQGVAKIIKLINFDEDMHVAVIGGLIRHLMRDEAEGFTELFKSDWYKKTVYQIVTEIVEDELNWASYLLSFGPIHSLTIQVFEDFIKYYANNRLSRIGLEDLYKDVKKTDIVTWFDMYKDINKDNTAQQESTAINYNIGNMSMDYGDNDLQEMLKELLDRNAK